LLVETLLAGLVTGRVSPSIFVRMEDVTKPRLQITNNVYYRGHITVDGKRFSIYIPHMRRYNLENIDEYHRENGVANKSTFIFVDQNNDGYLAGNECWFVDMPVRIDDKMFKVTSLDCDGKWISFQPLNQPPAGIVVGRQLPDFKLRASNGSTLTSKGFLGKVLLIDVWSVT
jgi:hypothetical protein